MGLAIEDTYESVASHLSSRVAQEHVDNAAITKFIIEHNQT